jgi:VWFA-related protein
VDLLQDFTAEHERLTRALGSLRVHSPPPLTPFPGTQGPFPGTNVGGTHLYDAVYLAATEELAGQVGRKAIVIITDGQDQGSKMKLAQAVEAAQRADAIIYGILFADRAFYGGFGSGYSGDFALKKMSQETGGRMVEVERNKGLAAAFDAIAEELRSQYSLAYSPTRPRQLGGFRRLTVKTLRSDLKVQARNGYYAQ